MTCGYTNLARFCWFLSNRGYLLGMIAFFSCCCFFPRAVTCQHTSHLCSWRRSHFGEAVDRPSLCVPLSAALKHTKKPNGQTLDDTPLNMGPPGDRTRHMSTERTEDFSWIVDLSWHGMQQGESEVVTTEEKKRKKTSAANTSKLQTRKGEILFS